jgi:hypothetical protein
MQRTGLKNPQYGGIPSAAAGGFGNVPRPPNPIMRAVEQPGLLTGPIDTQATWTAGGGDPAAQQTLAREVKAGVDTIAGIPSAVYHTAVDQPTEEEAATFGGQQEVSGPKRIGLAVHRLTTQPVQNAINWYRDALAGKIPDPVGQALSVSPEAVGSGAATALTMKAPSADAGVLEPIRARVQQLMPESSTASRVLKASGVGLSPAEKLTKAGGPSVTDANFQQAIETASPRLIEQNKLTPIKSVQDLADGAHTAAQRLWTDVIEPSVARHANEVIDGRAIASQIRSGIDPGMQDLFPEQAQAAADFADKFERPIPLSTASAYIKTLNAQLKSFYRMSPEGRSAMGITDGRVSSMENAADGLRDQIYSKLEALGEDDPRGARLQYGALKQIQKVFEKRAIVAGRQAPLNIQQVLSLALGGHPLSGFAAATGLRYLNSPDVLTQRGMSGMESAPGVVSRTLPGATAASAVSPRNKGNDSLGKKAADYVADKMPNWFTGTKR